MNRIASRLRNFVEYYRNLYVSLVPREVQLATGLSALILFLLFLGLENRFIQDDAFISFRYAKNLAEGNGLVWNPGDNNPVEGYTNFLWVLLIAAGEYFGLNPVHWSMSLGFLCAIGTLGFTFFLALLIGNRALPGFLATFLLGTNYSFSSYITGGLETQLQSFFLVMMVYTCVALVKQDAFQNNRLWFLLVLATTGSVLTRLDSVLPVAVALGFVAFSLCKNRGSYSPLFPISVRLSPFVVIILSWMLFKLWYYGDILPNTFYVKGSDTSWGILANGWGYVSSFFVRYGYDLLLVLLIWRFKYIPEKKYLLFLLVVIAVWLAYIIKVGGDFMEYRFLVPILPLMAIVVAFVIDSFAKSAAKIGMISLLLAASYHHAKTFHFYNGIESVQYLHAHIVSNEKNWPGIGRALGRLFSGKGNSVTIATTAAGAIPYYSGLPTIDLLGLNDAWVARNGIEIGNRAGHRKFAPLEYLLDSEVNIVLGHPIIRRKTEPARLNPQDYFSIPIQRENLPGNSMILSAPVDSDYVVDFLYLVEHVYIDQLIRAGSVKTFPVK